MKVFVVYVFFSLGFKLVLKSISLNTILGCTYKFVNYFFYLLMY